MAIHPIEFRYGTPEMKRIWEQENKQQRMLDIESALAQAEGELGIIPKEYADEIKAKEAEIANIHQTIADSKELFAEIEAEIQKYVAEKEELNKKHKEFLAKREELSKHMAELDKEAFRLNSRREGYEEASEKHINYMWEEYELTYTKALELTGGKAPENLEECKKELSVIKTMGFKIALCEVGSEFCPLLRLNEIPYDIVFLDGYVPKSMEDDGREQEIMALMSIISTRPVKIYGSCVTPEQIPLLEKIGADGYTFAKDEALAEKEWYVGSKENKEE